MYVGEIERELRERMTEHLRDVRLKKNKPINYHFGEKDHTLSDMAFIVLKRPTGLTGLSGSCENASGLRHCQLQDPSAAILKPVIFQQCYSDVVAPNDGK